MGKYDDLKQITPTDQFLRRIANELAELNRLKRLEIYLKFSYNDPDDRNEKLKKDLDDQA